VSELPDGVSLEGFSVNEVPEDEIETYDSDRLFDDIILIGEGLGWTETQLTSVSMAYDIAGYLHDGDTHRDKPYVYHLLRNASRILKRLNLKNPELIIATLLHDSVEDHSDIILEGEPSVSQDEKIRQEQALEFMEQVIPVSSTRILRGMTVPAMPVNKKDMSKKERLELYVKHVQASVKDIDVWVCKFVDWVDNGVGIVNAEAEIKPSKIRHRKEKYSMVQTILEVRYYQTDVQELLDDDAKEYVERMFELGRERLSAAKRVAKIGSTALDSSTSV